MARDYYYDISTELQEGVTPLEIIQMWDGDVKDEDLTRFPTGEISWDQSNGPSFLFSGGGRFLDISVETEAHHGFGDEFEDFLIDLATRVVGGALISVEGSDRIVHAYGQEPSARKAALIAYKHQLVADARARLLAEDPTADTNEDGVIALLITLKDLIKEAIENHIYDDNDERPDDCNYGQALAAAEAFLATKGR